MGGVVVKKISPKASCGNIMKEIYGIAPSTKGEVVPVSPPPMWFF